MLTVDAVEEFKTNSKELLLPCPFCGKHDSMNIDAYYLNNMPDMSGKPRAIISISIRHWCEPISGQPSSRPITMTGRDIESVIMLWNRRKGE